MKNKEISVLINLTAMASYDGMADYPIQFMTTGVLSRPEKEHYILQYQERQEDEQTGEITDSDICLDLRKDQVIMTRSGDFSSTMVFSRDQRFEGQYHTPYGNMEMAVYTHQLRCALGEREGTMHLKYQLHLHGTYASTNELHMTYQAGAMPPLTREAQ